MPEAGNSPSSLNKAPSTKHGTGSLWPGDRTRHAAKACGPGAFFGPVGEGQCSRPAIAEPLFGEPKSLSNLQNSPVSDDIQTGAMQKNLAPSPVPAARKCNATLTARLLLSEKKLHHSLATNNGEAEREGEIPVQQVCGRRHVA